MRVSTESNSAHNVEASIRDISKVETAKESGNFLRGTVAEVLASETAEKFDHDDLQLLKFHGTYQQDDRDLRQARRKEGLGKAYSFMLRITLPAGKLSSEQYLELDRMADQFANGTLRVTTRQAIQFHGVIKSELKATIAKINDALMTTLAACGDVCRNVMATAAPFDEPIHRAIRETALEIAQELRPATKAYHEIWIDGERTVSTLEQEPFYGKNYLPRKFKTGVTLMGDNQIDIYSYDAGLIGVVDNDRLAGFNVVAGGGLGMSHGRANTYAQLAHSVGFVEPENGVAVIKAIASIYRDFGNRSDRKHARLKYLINDRGLNWFEGELKRRIDFDLQPSFPLPEIDTEDWLGPHRQTENLWFYGLFVQSGRIQDDGQQNVRSAIREIVGATGCDVILTAQQSVLFANLNQAQVSLVKAILAKHRVPEVESLSGARRYSMACPALPTCGMAVAESERVVSGLIEELETLLESYGLSDEPLTFRMTGCPNGCARPYTADIALVGRRPGIYHLYVGGRIQGDRVADLYEGDIRVEDFIQVIRPLIAAWAVNRIPDEGLGDFYQRVAGRRQARKQITGKESPIRNQLEHHLVQIQSQKA